jgi:hypothetical protein
VHSDAASQRAGMDVSEAQCLCKYESCYSRWLWTHFSPPLQPYPAVPTTHYTHTPKQVFIRKAPAGAYPRTARAQYYYVSEGQCLSMRELL